MTWTWVRITGLIVRWWLPLSLGAGALGGAVYTLARDAVYAAEAYVVVAGGDPAQAAGFAAAYARISSHPGFLTGGTDGPDGLRAAASPDAPLVRLTSVATGAREAADRVNRAAAALIAYANGHAADTRVRLVSLAAAAPPLRPSSPVPLLSVAVGACAAALVAGLVRLAAPWAPRQPRREPAALTGAPA
ncbi:hypothetical protein ACIBQ1_02520 [Nonomuraea sp. NPDC050153]|uniref:hypothetical protein n=1 Tax=Nonomuraea sp. NPDC050153 TaxID=3364359 RepID=UPI0037AAF35D